MNIHITDEATQWYEQELDIQSGDAVRFLSAMVELVVE